jgi:hypothetical protein
MPGRSRTKTWHITDQIPKEDRSVLSTKVKFRNMAIFTILAMLISLVNFRPAQATAALPRVALLGVENGTRLIDIINKVTAAGVGLYTVTNLSACPLATPTLATLQQFDSVMVWTDCFLSDSVSFGNVLADYIDGGGHVVVTAHAWWPFTTQGLYWYNRGRFTDGGYILLTLAPAELADLPGI